MIVLAAHGAPATDYPRARVGLLMALEMAGRRLARLPGVQSWRHSLEREVRAWPRTGSNDPYKTAVDELAVALAARINCRVIVGYNEFCAPEVGEALHRAVEEGAKRVLIIPTMLLRGNEHTEAEIAGAVDDARQQHPAVTFVYAWPFDLDRLVSLYADQAVAYGSFGSY